MLWFVTQLSQPAIFKAEISIEKKERILFSCKGKFSAVVQT